MVSFTTIDEEKEEESSGYQSDLSELSLTVDDIGGQEVDRRLSWSSDPGRRRARHVTSALQRFTPASVARFRRSESRESTSSAPEIQHDVRRVGSSPEIRTTSVRRRHFVGMRSFIRNSTSASLPSPDTAHGNLGAGEEAQCLPGVKILELRRVIGHRAWWATTIFFIWVLLFLPPFQELWLPKAADATVDVILTLASLFLAVDIVIRSIVDRSYFAWSRAGRWRPHVGSFMFWFDAIALLTILSRLSYLDASMNKPHQVRVELDENGLPTNGSHSTPIVLRLDMLLTIGRVGLMARFIRTSVLDHFSSKIYWSRFFYPTYWLRKLAVKYHQENDENANQPRLSQRHQTSKGGPDPLDSSFRQSPPLVSSFRQYSGSSGRYSGSSGRYSTEQQEGQLEPCNEEGLESLRQRKTSKLLGVKDFFKGFQKKPPTGTDSSDGEPTTAPTDTPFFSNDSNGSHVGAAMRELTGQRIATGALLSLLLIVVCAWSEPDTTKVMTMLTLHRQTARSDFAELSVNVAHSSVIPTLFNYTRVDETSVVFSAMYDLSNGNVDDLRQREILSVEIYTKGSSVHTYGLFDNSQVNKDNAKMEIVTEIIVLIVWIIGVASFAGPVMTLVVEPIERMVRLLSMLMKDPLGYQNTPQYCKLKQEEEVIANKTMWPKDALKGMETNFLMSTLLRIGSLMRVGFGSAGVEIIRDNLERDQHKDVLFLAKQGRSVSCIFLFCDIRQFTDATECLQEEVFVFTNKIAAVVHSFCHSYGGDANKNIGDAFLVSWLLDEAPREREKDEDDPFPTSLDGDSDLYANNNQADKALLSVVKISMALHYDNYYVDDMKEAPRKRLLKKLSKRKGPIVQMGFGLHAGRAVQGAIGSQRKLDATYISESVERAEFLESSTKQYGVPLLMSSAFFNLLDSSNRLRCRKIDRLLMLTEEHEDMSDPHEMIDSGEKMDIYTYDMDIDALWRTPTTDDDKSTVSNNDVDQRRTYGPVSSNTKRRPTLVRRASFSAGMELPELASLRQSFRWSSNKEVSRESSRNAIKQSSKNLGRSMQTAADELVEKPLERTLVLPTGITRYSEKAWLEPDIKMIRRDYVSNGIIFPKYQEGLTAFYAKDWKQAKRCFEFVLYQRDDGPSRYFLNRIAEHDGIPPRNFIGFNVVHG